MKITDLLSVNTIDLNATAKDKTDIIKKAVKLIAKSGAITNLTAYEKGVFAREKESTTGVGEGIAIPHCKSKTVKKPALAAMIIKKGVDYKALDNEPVKLLFLIAAPDNKDNVHLDVLARLSNLLMHEEFKNKLLKAKNKKDFLKIIDEAENEKKINEANKTTVQYPQILAATSCPTGVAHTYMAQEALEKAANKMKLTIKVETNGASGVKNAITDDEIKHAEVIIIAADAYVDVERFIGKKVNEVSVSRAIKDAEGLIIESLSDKIKVYKGLSGKGINNRAFTDSTGKKKSASHTFYRHLMSGISHMIPFVVAGGILLAIAYIIDACSGISKDAVDGAGNLIFGNATTAAKVFHMLGADLGLGLMLPVLGGYIAYSIAGRAGLVAGFVGGFAASKGQFSLLYFIALEQGEKELVSQLENTAAGFLGAIFAGFIAGYFVLFIRKKTTNVPRSLDAVFSMLIHPLVATFVVGAAMLLINVPLAYLNIGISTGLNKLGELKFTILLGAIVSGLMATDMGGPINKAAHYFVLGLITTGLSKASSNPEFWKYAQQMMSANIVGIMTPPIGIALATWLFPQKFAKTSRTTSIANVVTGCCGITEGAIPYLVNDPVRVLISTISGAAIGGAVSVTLGGVAIAPEGGMISMAVMGSSCWIGIVSTIIGSLITCFLLGLLKRRVNDEEAQLGKWKGIPTGFIDNRVEKIIQKREQTRKLKQKS